MKNVYTTVVAAVTLFSIALVFDTLMPLNAAAASAAVADSAASAPPGGASGPGGHPPGPPPEAIAACKGKTEGAQVSFTGRRGETLTGVCQLFNGVLAARPQGGPGGPGGQGGTPPPPPR